LIGIAGAAAGLADLGAGLGAVETAVGATAAATAADGAGGGAGVGAVGLAVTGDEGPAPAGPVTTPDATPPGGGAAPPGAVAGAFTICQAISATARAASADVAMATGLVFRAMDASCIKP